jgi:hypothetical protein
MRTNVPAWRCELCGHAWLSTSDLPPEKCARCRKRGWHTTIPDALLVFCGACDRRYEWVPESACPGCHTVDWFLLSREQRTAHAAVAKGRRNGSIVPRGCEVCGKKAEAHHDDYSRPMDVRWLCRRHHSQHHALCKRAIAKPDPGKPAVKMLERGGGAFPPSSALVAGHDTEACRIYGCLQCKAKKQMQAAL